MLKERSYLIQRLNKATGIDNPFSFGGGLKNGGLSDDAMSLLRGIFSFDYMGAAEFEFGAVPKALQKLGNDKNLTTAQFTITHGGRDHTIYILCNEADVDEVTERIKPWLLPYGERPHMKEQPNLERALDDEEWCRTKGWLELNNGWFAFADYEMFANTAKLFGLKTEEA